MINDMSVLNTLAEVSLSVRVDNSPPHLDAAFRQAASAIGEALAGRMDARVVTLVSDEDGRTRAHRLNAPPTIEVSARIGEYPDLSNGQPAPAWGLRVDARLLEPSALVGSNHNTRAITWQAEPVIAVDRKQVAHAVVDRVMRLACEEVTAQVPRRTQVDCKDAWAASRPLVTRSLDPQWGDNVEDFEDAVVGLDEVDLVLIAASGEPKLPGDTLKRACDELLGKAGLRGVGGQARSPNAARSLRITGRLVGDPERPSYTWVDAELFGWVDPIRLPGQSSSCPVWWHRSGVTVPAQGADDAIKAAYLRAVAALLKALDAARSQSGADS